MTSNWEGEAKVIKEIQFSRIFSTPDQVNNIYKLIYFHDIEVNKIRLKKLSA